MDARGRWICFKKQKWSDFTHSFQRWNTTGAFSSKQYCCGDLECERQFCEQFPLWKGSAHLRPRPPPNRIVGWVWVLLWVWVFWVLWVWFWFIFCVCVFWCGFCLFFFLFWLVWFVFVSATTVFVFLITEIRWLKSGVWFAKETQMYRVPILCKSVGVFWFWWDWGFLHSSTTQTGLSLYVGGVDDS